MLHEKLAGTGVALVTPFNKDLSIDFDGLTRVINHVSKSDVAYLVVMGSTGEAPTIEWSEKLEVLEFILDNNPKNLPVVMGVGGNNTSQMINDVKALKDYPLIGILSSSPHYNKPSQQGIIKHFEAFASASPFPVILYNVPARTGSNMNAPTTILLSKHPNIMGMKEASRDLSQCAKIIAETDDNFLLVSGDDALTLPLISLGARGVISVIANLLPVEFSEMVAVALDGKTEEASKLNKDLLTHYELVGLEGNPVSLKVGMKAHQLIEDHVRLPLVSGSQDLFEKFLQHK